MPKERLRAEARERRQRIRDRASRSETIAKRLFEQEAWRKSRVVAAYASFGTEVETDSILARVLDDGKELRLPVVDSVARTLSLHRVRDLSTLRPGHWGIREPAPEAGNGTDAGTADAGLGDVDLVVVPGLAFDTRGHRLGYGRGYFDRLLASIPLARRIGLAFEDQLIERIPEEVHDVPVHVVVTEERVIEAA